MTDDTTQQGLALHAAPAAPAIAVPATAGGMLSMVAEATRDSTIDAAKMVALTNLAISLRDDERRSEFNKAKMAAIMEMPRITKRGAITGSGGKVQSRYSKFEDIHAAVMPILKRHGLVISFRVGHAGQMVTVQPILAHLNGHVEEGGEMSLPIDTTGSKNGTQGAGSAASYGKRHSLKAMLNIVEGGEDDDGQSAGRGGPPMKPWEAELVEEGQKHARQGMIAYTDWFKSKPSAERGWLAFGGHHDTFKALASGESE